MTKPKEVLRGRKPKTRVKIFVKRGRMQIESYALTDIEPLGLKMLEARFPMQFTGKVVNKILALYSKKETATITVLSDNMKGHKIG